MLDVKKLLTKVLTATDKSRVRTVTVTGTTNGNGAIFISGTGKVPLDAEVLSVRTASNANYMCIPWVYNNSSWYVKVLDWQSMASQNNKSISLTIHYRVN